jgi:ankyrin repeat protein
LQADYSEHGDTALHLACRQGSLEILETMLNALDDPKSIVKSTRTRSDDEPETLIDVAECEGHDEVVDYLNHLIGENQQTGFGCLIY